MKSLNCAAAAAAAFLAGALAGPAGAQEADCADIDLVFASPSTPYCWAADETGRAAGSEGVGRWRAGWEIRALKESDRYVVVQLVRAGMRTYLDKAPVRDQDDNDSWFDGTRDWGEAYELGRFEIADFEAIWGGSSGEYWICRGFTRYKRPVSGSPGYQMELRGSYCVAPGITLRPADLESFLGSITY